MEIAETGNYKCFTLIIFLNDFLSSFFVNGDQYASELNVARQYANQKVWPRAVYVRRARFVLVTFYF